MNEDIRPPKTSLQTPPETPPNRFENGNLGGEIADLPLGRDDVVVAAADWVIIVFRPSLGADMGPAPAAEVHTRDEHDRQGGAAGGLQEVGGDVELVMLRVVDAGLVEEWVAGRFSGAEQE